MKHDNLRKQTPLLSILIPAYENAEGVTRILKSIPTVLNESIEVIVSDDSKSEVVSNAIETWNADREDKVKYLRHGSTGNAVDNLHN